MSYDLEVRSDANYSKSVPLEEIATIMNSLPGVLRMEPAFFVLDRTPAGIHVAIDVAYESGTEEEAISIPERVNCAAFSVPYPFLGKAGPVALEMALQVAEKLGWSVYDPQGDCEVTRASFAGAIKLQESSGAAARSVLDRAAAAEASLGELFSQEMWNHGLLVGAGSFVLAAVVSIWLMFTWEWPKERFGKHLPWTVILGGLSVLWLKALAQAYLRLRRLRGGTRE